MSDIVDDPGKQSMFEVVLSTEAPKKKGVIAKSWETALFENMPVAAAITLLTKIQTDIRFVEGETLSTLLTNVDIGDYRVNLMNAFVIPKSQIVTNGMPFEAQIVLAAVDSTKQPEYYLGTTLLSSNTFSIPTSGVGDKSVSGKVVADGIEYPYEVKYSVTESSVTIAPIMMKFLYESIENPIEIAMPGVPSGAVTASLKGTGSIVAKERNIWEVSGLSIASENVEIIATANVGGRTVSESKEFKVRPLPDALPFISSTEADGRVRKYTNAIPKRILIASTGINAAIDDGVLNIPYPVTGFTIRITDKLGNSIPTVSKSSAYTPEQKEVLRNMPTGTRFSISEIKALDPTGKQIDLRYGMQVLVTN
jgi:gliding motility-associated protein GldM